MCYLGPLRSILDGIRCDRILLRETFVWEKMGREQNKLGEPRNCDASRNQGRRQTGSFGGNVLDHLQPQVGPARLSGSPRTKVMGQWNPCLPGLSLSWYLVSLQHSVVGWDHPAESLASAQTQGCHVGALSQLRCSWCWRGAVTCHRIGLGITQELSLCVFHKF